MPKILNRQGRPILDWRAWSRPKEEYQWRAGRSAMELARAWFTSPQPRVPPEIASLLGTSPLMRSFVFETGWPERVTALPERGEGRNHDLVLRGDCAGIPTVVCVEAKVDEELGPPIGRYWAAMHKRKKSRLPQRIEKLLSMIFGTNAKLGEGPWSALRYQLLTALVGTAIEASRQRCERAALIVHEFRTASATSANLAVNDRAFKDFLRALGVREPRVGVLHGPFNVAISPTLERFVPVLIGKAVYDWRAP